MSKTTIDIQIRGSDGLQRKEKVPAYSCKTPGLAIHKTYHSDGSTGAPWNISHTSTGKCLYPHIKTLGYARAIDKELSTCGIDFTQSEDDVTKQGRAINFNSGALRAIAAMKHDEAQWEAKLKGERKKVIKAGLYYLLHTEHARNTIIDRLKNNDGVAMFWGQLIESKYQVVQHVRIDALKELVEGGQVTTAVYGYDNVEKYTLSESGEAK